MDDLEELVAYHESGHAVMAVSLGGVILHVSIEPNKDDGPARFGESIVQWPLAARTQIELSEIQVSLAGPVVEMIYSGDQLAIDSVPEFADDWQRSLANVAAIKTTFRSQLLLLYQVQNSLRDYFEKENHWAAVSAVADELQAHETIEHDTVHDICAFWNLI